MSKYSEKLSPELRQLQDKLKQKNKDTEPQEKRQSDKTKSTTEKLKFKNLPLVITLLGMSLGILGSFLLGKIIMGFMVDIQSHGDTPLIILLAFYLVLFVFGFNSISTSYSGLKTLVNGWKKALLRTTRAKAVCVEIIFDKIKTGRQSHRHGSTGGYSYSYKPVISVVFENDGRRETGGRCYPVEKTFKSETAAKRAARRYKPGKIVTVYYQKNKISNVGLAGKRNMGRVFSTRLFQLIISAYFLTFGVFSFFYSIGSARSSYM